MSRDILKEQKEQLESLIQRIGEELDEAIDLQESSVMDIGCEEYKIQQKRIIDLGVEYDRLSRLYEERFNKPVENPVTWKDKIDWNGLLKVGLGAGLAFLGDLALTNLVLKRQNSGDMYNDRYKRSTFGSVLKKLF